MRKTKWSELEVGQFFLWNNRVYEKMRDTGYLFGICNSMGIDSKMVLVPVDSLVEAV